MHSTQSQPDLFTPPAPETIHIPYSQFINELARLNSEGKRVVAMERGKNGWVCRIILISTKQGNASQCTTSQVTPKHNT